jgi:hypothetical protein
MPDGRISAYTFFVQHMQQVELLKGALTKALIERNVQDTYGGQSPKSSQSEPEIDAAWLQQQLVADHIDVAMQDLSDQEQDFDIDKFNEDYLDRYERETKDLEAEEAKHRNYFDDEDENEVSRFEADLEENLKDRNNEETMQALSYDRAFVTNGPVIKVYKNSADIDKHQ